jgi:hypothetical protein
MWSFLSILSALLLTFPVKLAVLYRPSRRARRVETVGTIIGRA